MIKAHNIMEELVYSKLKQILTNLDCCKCEKCQADIAALALNELPPRYVSTKEGAVISITEYDNIESTVDIIGKLTKAATLVKNKPRH